MRICLLLALCLALVSVEVEFEGRKIVFYPPAEGAPTGILLWFHAAGTHPNVAAGWWRGHGFTQRGLAVAVPPNRLKWNPEVESLFAARLAAELQRRLRLDPARTIIGGEVDGAAFAMHLATAYQGAFWSAVLLARGGLGGRWDDAGEDPPVFGIYANANDRLVPIDTMRTIERRLGKTGYPVRFALGMAETGWDNELAGLLEQLCVEVGIELGPAPPPPAQSAVPGFDDGE